eukprot:scaffold211947_cov17-Tisochrysis_lutea.AAC.1
MQGELPGKVMLATGNGGPVGVLHSSHQLGYDIHKLAIYDPRFVQGELPLRVKLATGDGGPDRVYHFDHQLGYDPRHLVMFEHVEGATFCE